MKRKLLAALALTAGTVAPVVLTASPADAVCTYDESHIRESTYRVGIRRRCAFNVVHMNSNGNWIVQCLDDLRGDPATYNHCWVYGR